MSTWDHKNNGLGINVFLLHVNRPQMKENEFAGDKNGNES